MEGERISLFLLGELQSCSVMRELCDTRGHLPYWSVLVENCGPGIELRWSEENKAHLGRNPGNCYFGLGFL